MSGRHTTREDVEDREWGSLNVEFDVRINVSQDRLVHVLVIVRHRCLRSCVYKGVDLELIGIFVCLVDLVRAEAIWLLLSDCLLVVNCSVVLIVSS